MNEKYLKTKEGSIEDTVKLMQNKVLESDYQDKFKKALDKEGKPLGHMTGAEKKAFFGKVDKMHTAKNEEKDIPKGHHKMPDGTIMKDSEHKKEDISERGGALSCRLEENRVLITGDAKTFLEGFIHLV